MKKQIEVGQIVMSLSGRDKGEFYVVLNVLEKCVLLANGTTKTLEKPKKKNKLHIKTTANLNTEIANKITKNQKINDQMIYHTLYEFKKKLKGSLNNGN